MPAPFRAVLFDFGGTLFSYRALGLNTSELMLIGINAYRFELEPARLNLLSSDDRIHGDLRYNHWGGAEHRLHLPRVFLASFLAGPRGLAALSAGARLYRDDRPVLDYATSRVDPKETREIPIVERLREHLDPVEGSFTGKLSAEDAAAIREIRAQNLEEIAASALARRAEALIRTGDHAQGAQLLSEALRRNPQNFATHRTLGDVRMNQKRFEEARTHFSEAILIREHDLRARRGLATALHRLGRLDEAIRHYSVALELRPDDAEAHNNLGAALAQRGELRRALQHFEEAMRLRPDYADAERNVERAQSALGGS